MSKLHPHGSAGDALVTNVLKYRWRNKHGVSGKRDETGALLKWMQFCVLQLCPPGDTSLSSRCRILIDLLSFSSPARNQFYCWDAPGFPSVPPPRACGAFWYFIMVVFSRSMWRFFLFPIDGSEITGAAPTLLASERFLSRMCTVLLSVSLFLPSLSKQAMKGALLV